MARKRRSTKPEPETTTPPAETADDILDRLTAADPPAAPRLPDQPRPEPIRNNHRPPTEPPAGDIGEQAITLPMDYAAAVPAFRVHIDMHLRGAPLRALRRLTVALDTTRATDASGRRITSYAGALRWMLERLDAEGSP